MMNLLFRVWLSELSIEIAANTGAAKLKIRAFGIT